MTKRNQLVLSENEQIVLFVQHHWSSLLPSCLTFCVCCVLLNLGSLPEIIDDLLFYAAIIMAVVIIRTVIYIHNEAIIITNKNLYIQYGLFNVNVLKVEYSQVELIDIVHKGIESLFGCGTIHITPQSNIPNINMGYVKNPEMVYNVYQNARKSFLQDKIRQMKELSDEGIISQTEYEFEKNADYESEFIQWKTVYGFSERISGATAIQRCGNRRICTIFNQLNIQLVTRS